MAGKYPLVMLLLNVGELYILEKLEHWIRKWWVNHTLIKLDDEGWFNQGNRLECYLNYPPHEEINTSSKIIMKASQNRNYVSHVIVCLQLMTHLWRNTLGKVAKVMFIIPTGLPVLRKTFHETLYIALIISAISISNWK